MTHRGEALDAVVALVQDLRIDERRSITNPDAPAEVVPFADLDAAVDAWVADIRRCSPAAIRATKQSALDALHLSLADAAAYVSPAERAWQNGTDRIEGPRAFAEKRTPNWA